MHYDNKDWAFPLHRGKTLPPVSSKPWFILWILLLLLLMLVSFTQCVSFCEPCDAAWPLKCVCESTETEDCSVRCQVLTGSLSNLDQLPERDATELDLSGNSLTSVEDTILQHFKRLAVLKLHNNQLTKLPKNFIDSSSSLEYISLRDNPWHCGCEILEFKEWLLRQRRHLVDVDQIVCYTPLHLKGESVIEINIEHCMHMEEVSHEILQDISVSEKLLRVKRSSNSNNEDNCFDELFNKGKLPNNCEASDFGSCLVTTDGLVATVHFQDVTSTEDPDGCEENCRLGGYIYSHVYSSDDKHLCFCGLDHVTCSDCKDNGYADWQDGQVMCSNVLYLGGTGQVVLTEPQFTVEFNTPYSTNSTAILEAPSLVDGDEGEAPGFYVDFSDGYGVRKWASAETLTYQYSIPGQYNTSIAISTDQLQHNSLPITVQDLPVFNQDMVAGLASSLTAVGAALEQGTRLQLSWVRTDVNGTTTQGLYCMEGWMSFRSKCLLTFEEKEKYEDAAKICHQEGGRLLSVNDEDELEEFSEYIDTADEHYTGATHTGDGVYLWDGLDTKAYFTQDQLIASDVSGTPECVAILNGQLLAIKCSERLHFTCEKDPVQCRHGGIFNPVTQQCYLVYGEVEPVDWHSASSECEAILGDSNGMLATVHTEDVQINRILNTAGANSDVWIGLSNQNTLRQWQWVDGSSVGYSQVDLPLTSADRCVKLTATDWTWSLDSCHTHKAFICQYNAYETVSVSKHFAGSLVSGFQSGISYLEEGEKTTVNTTLLYIFPDSVFSQSGKVQSWIFEANTLDEPIDFILQVYRPEPTQDCVEDWCNQPDEACLLSQRFCPFSYTCLNMSQPCTCQIYDQSGLCTSETTIYRLVAESAVNLPEASVGLQKMDVSYGVRYGDVIGIQIPSASSLPVKCVEGVTDLRAERYYFTKQPDWIIYNHTVDMAGSEQQMIFCKFMAIFTEPIFVEPPLNLVHPAISDYNTDTFNATVSNSLKSSLIQAEVLIYELQDLSVHHPCQIMQGGQNRICAVDKEIQNTLVFRVVSLERDIHLHLNTTEIIHFKSECPLLDDYVCQKPLRGIFYYAQFPIDSQWYLEDTISIFAIAVTGNKEERLDFVIHPMTKLSHLVLNVSQNQLMLGEESEFIASVVTTSEVTWIWNVSGVILSNQDTGRLKHNFTKTGLHSVKVTTRNAISELTEEKNVTVFDAGVANVHFSYEKIAEEPNQLNVTLTVVLEPYSTGYLEVVLFNASNLVTPFRNENPLQNTVNMSFLHYYFLLQPQNITVKILHPLNNATVSAFHGDILLFEPLLSVNISSNSTLQNMVETDSVTLFNVTTYPLQNIGKVYYTFQFGDWSVPFTTEDNECIHIYNESGTYNVTVQASNNISLVETLVEFIVVDPLRNLRVRANEHNFMGYQTRIRLKLGQGTRVTYSLNDGIHDNFTIQSKRTFYLVYEEPGIYNVTGIAENDFGELITSKLVVVHPLDYFELNGITSSTCVPLYGESHFTAAVVFHKPSFLKYEWTVDGIDQDTNAVTMTHVFNKTGTYIVGVLVSSPNNTINASYTNKTVCVEEILENLTLTSNVSVIALKKDTTEFAKLSAYLLQGSDYQIEWTYFDETIQENQFEQVLRFNEIGVYDISVSVQNSLNTLHESLSITVFEVIKGLHVAFNNITIDRRGGLPSGVPTNITIYTEAGSDIEYQWNVETVNGVIVIELTNMTSYHEAVFEKGEYLAHFSAKNPVSSVNVTIEISVQDIIENLTLESPKETYTNIGTEFKANLLHGSNVTYHWTLDKYNTTNTLELSEKGPIAKYEFDSAGLYRLGVEAQNNVSLESIETEVVVLDLMFVEMEVNQQSPPYIPSQTMTIFSVSLPIYMVSPSYFWTISADSIITNTTEEQLLYYFDNPGVYTVEVVVTQGFFLVQSSLTVYVEEEIENLTIILEDVVDNKFNIYDAIPMRLAVQKGSNLSYQWNMGNGDIITGLQEHAYGYNVSGVYVINGTVWNNVSELSQVVSVEVMDRVKGLQLLYCCDEPVRSNTEIFFFASVRTGTDVDFNWTVYDDPVTELEGQNISHVFPQPGNFTIGVSASNGYSQDTFYNVVMVLDPITDVEVTADRKLWNLYFYEGNGLNITFTATAIGGKNTVIQYEWYVNHTLRQDGLDNVFTFEFVEGFHRVHVTAFNRVSNVTQKVSLFQIQKLLCAPPVLKLTATSERHEVRSLAMKVEVTVENCNVYETAHQWYIYRSSCDSEDQVKLPTSVGILTPSLSLPARTLDYGKYCFNMTSQYLRTPATSSITIMVEVHDTPLKALIAGGSRRLMPKDKAILLDGSYSYDPDKILTRLSYYWTCSSSKGLMSTGFDVVPTVSGYSDNENPNDGCFEPSSEMFVRIPNGTLSENRVYNFTLTVSAENRISTSTAQVIRLGLYAVEVSIDCASCRENNMYAVSYSQHLKLLGSCTLCTEDTQYMWTVFSSDNETVPLNENTTNSGNNKPVLSIKNGVLNKGTKYTFSLSVRMQWREGLAVLDLIANLPPSEGTCHLSIEESYVTAMEDKVEISCDGWVHNSLFGTQLIYHIYAMKDSTDWYPIYRGTSSNTSFFLSGNRDVDSVHLKVEVINARGAETLALNETVEVRAPNPGNNRSLSAYLWQVGTRQLSVLKHQNNPKALLQYVIALNLQLNAESKKSAGSQSDIDKRILLRREMILIMNDTLTVSAIDDLQQMAYVLMLITTYTDEFPPEADQYMSVIRLLTLMTTPLKDEVSPGMTGEEFMPYCILASADNLLQIIKLDTNLTLDMYRKLSETLQTLIEGTLLLKLQTQLVEENPAEYTTDNLFAQVQHIYAENLVRELDLGNGNRIEFPDSILRDFHGQGIFQSMISYSSNPNNWELPNGVEISSQVTNVYFTNTSSAAINLTDLTEPIVAAFRSPLGDASARRKRRSTDDDNDVVSVEVGPGETISSPVNVSESVAADSVLHIKFEAFTESPVGDVFVSAYLAKGYIASSDNHDFQIDVYVNTEENYTFFITDSFASPDSSEMYYITLYNPGTQDSVNITVEHYVSSCQYYDTGEGVWSSEGCSVVQEYNPLTTTCHCHQLAMYGAIFSNSPARIKFEAQSLASISPVIYITASIIALLFVALLPLCRHLDKEDLRSIRYVPLCGKDATYKYEVTIVTGRRFSAGTSSNVGIRLFGKSAKSENKYLEKPGGFQRNSSDTLLIATQNKLGDIEKVLLWHDNTGLDASWYVCRVIVRDLQDNNKYYFLVNSWLSVIRETHSKAGSEIQRELTVTDEKQLTSFGTRFSEELYKGLVERHLWVSLIDKPARSYFTRVQRFTCYMTMLCCFMLSNALWYDLTHSPQDYRSTSTYLLWSDVIVGLGTCIVVFLPIILIVQLYRHSLPKENTNKISAKPGTAETIVMDIDIDDHSDSMKCHNSNRRVIHLPPDLSREVSEESSFMTAKPGILKRTGNIHRVVPMPEQSERLPVHRGNSGLWSNENIIKSWPEKIPSHQESRQPSAVSFKNTKTISVEGWEDADNLIEELDSFHEKQSQYGQHRHRRDHSALHSSRARELSVVDLSMGSMVDMDYINSRDTTSVSFSSHQRTRKISHLSSTSEGDSLPDIVESEPMQITAPVVPVYGPNHHILDDTVEDIDNVQYLPLPPPVRRQCFLPHWCVYVAYILCSILCLGSLVTVFVMATDFGNVIPFKWLLATVMSCVFSMFVIEPLKVLVVALGMAFLTSHLEQCEDQLYFKPILQSNEKLKDTRIRPVGGYSLLHAKEEGQKIRRIKTIIRQFIAYTLFLFLVLLLNYANYNQSAFQYTSYIKNTFTKNLFENTSTFADIRTYDQYWDWLEETAGPSFHNWNEYEEAVSGYNLGMVRLRQIRSTVKQCSAENAFKDIHLDYFLSKSCYADPSWTEDKETYGPSWELTFSGNGSYWRYSSPDQFPAVGHMETYSGGGYIQLLGTTLTETISIITELKDLNWLDRGTRAVFLEWTEYSVGSPLFAIGRILMEFPISGGVIPTIQVQAVDVLNFSGQTNIYMLCEILLSFMFVYLLIVTILNIKEKKWSYFKEFWNWMDLVLVLLTLTSVAMYGHVTRHCKQVYHSFLQDRHEFTSFADAAHWITSWRTVNAMLLFCLMFVVVYQLRFIKFMSKFTRTIHSASWKLLGIALFFIAFLCFYSQLGYLWFGTLIYTFHEVGLGIPGMLQIYSGDAGSTLAFMFLYDSPFSLFFVVTFLSLVFVCVFGLSLAALQDSYKAIKSQMMYHSTLETQDHEMVEVMIDRFKRWIGIKKEKPAFRRVKFLGEPSISSRNSSAKTLRSPVPPSSESSGSYSIVDEEMEEMHRIENLVRLPKVWGEMTHKLDQIIKQDEEEARMVKTIESQLQQQQTLHSKVPPKQPESVSDPSNSPFKGVKPKVKASAFPFKLSQIAVPSDKQWSAEPKVDQNRPFDGTRRKEPKVLVYKPGQSEPLKSAGREPETDYNTFSGPNRKGIRTPEESTRHSSHRPVVPPASHVFKESGADFSFTKDQRVEHGSCVESAKQSSQPLVPPVSRSRMASSASTYGGSSSLGGDGQTGKLRRPSVIKGQGERDDTDLCARQVWEDT